jgi:hypothetical protein
VVVVTGVSSLLSTCVVTTSDELAAEVAGASGLSSPVGVVVAVSLITEPTSVDALGACCGSTVEVPPQPAIKIEIANVNKYLRIKVKGIRFHLKMRDFIQIVTRKSPGRSRGPY